MANGSVRIEMNRAGAKSILQSEEVQGFLREKAEAIANAAGGAPDFEVDVRVGVARARASIFTATEDGMRAEAEDRTLSNAVDAARG